MAAGKCDTTGKTRYQDRREARLALDKLRIRRAGHKTERSAYHCRFCDSWHISSMGERPTGSKTRMEPHQRWRWGGKLKPEED